MGWSYLSWRTWKRTMWQRRNILEETPNSLASSIMILTQPNSTFSCTLHLHLAPHYCSLHLPSPPHSPTMETPHQEMCGSLSPISWVTPLPPSNTLTCLIMLLKIKLFLPRDGRTRWKPEMSSPALSLSPGRWLSLGSHLSSWLGGNAPALSQGRAQLGQGGWLAAGLGGDGGCSRCADQELFFSAAEALEATSKWIRSTNWIYMIYMVFVQFS